MKPPVEIVPHKQALAQAVAQEIVKVANRSIIRRRLFALALAGGKTPQPVYHTLAGHTYQEQINWNKTHVFLSDERFVPHDNDNSNAFHIRQNLLQHLPIPDGNIHFPQTQDISLQDAAHAYEKDIMRIFEKPVPRFDLMLLGIGQDGHTASIFPESPEAKEPGNDFVIPVTNAPKPPLKRISFSYRLINHARRVFILATGKQKAETVKQILQSSKSQTTLPAGRVKPKDGKLVWYLDKEAAANL